MLRLLDLPWNDVVYTQIFSRLDLQDLVRLRCLSTEFEVLVDNYIATWETLDLSRWHVSFEPSAFEVLVTTCMSLRRVNLTGSVWLGSRHVVELLHRHPELTHLDLSGCNGEHMRGSDFVEITKCRNLTSVRLRGCAWVEEPFLMSLLRYNENLRELVLADCYRLSDEALLSMFHETSRLTCLSLKNATLSDRSLYELGSRCRTIRELDLRSCSKITDAGLLSLRSLPALKKLRVSGCVLITERGLASMRGRVEIDLPAKLICGPGPLSLQV
ncbi:F-box/LRR-repeat protein 15 isoform X2 [Cephus cinctus]|nr:F-box/LRR-repeat protein 15 isoform X2 [Cephus cinctus]XP_024936475.1 F-box/LRR-repeat protein 15 isoform X2 [Cephus cinctus]